MPYEINSHLDRSDLKAAKGPLRHSFSEASEPRQPFHHITDKPEGLAGGVVSPETYSIVYPVG